MKEKPTQAKYHLTFDIDWAPDFCIENILNKLRAVNVKATFFITHQSDILFDIEKAGHNIGIHPNFLPNSTHGTSIESVIEHLLVIYPKAQLIRMHGLVQSSSLLYNIFKSFPQLHCDLSLFMYQFPFVGSSKAIFADGVEFKRINYNWEDDVAFYDKNFHWITPQFYGAYTLFNFHPIHLALNSKNNINYEAIKSTHIKPLYCLKEKEVLPFKNAGEGTSTFFDTILNTHATTFDLIELL